MELRVSAPACKDMTPAEPLHRIQGLVAVICICKVLGSLGFQLAVPYGPPRLEPIFRDMVFILLLIMHIFSPIHTLEPAVPCIPPRRYGLVRLLAPLAQVHRRPGHSPRRPARPHAGVCALRLYCPDREGECMGLHCGGLGTRFQIVCRCSARCFRCTLYM